MRVFSDDRIEAMHEASLEVLENLGVKVLLPEARDLLIAGGATLKGEDMVHIDREMVTAALCTAPRSIVGHAGCRERDVLLEPGSLVFQPGAGAPHATDLVKGRRPGTSDDLRDLVLNRQHF